LQIRVLPMFLMNKYDVSIYNILSELFNCKKNKDYLHKWNSIVFLLKCFINQQLQTLYKCSNIVKVLNWQIIRHIIPNQRMKYLLSCNSSLVHIDKAQFMIRCYWYIFGLKTSIGMLQFTTVNDCIFMKFCTNLRKASERKACMWK